jgi:hypothetical protein
MVLFLTLMSKLAINLTSQECQQTLIGMFEVKNVPLKLLGSIETFREFHRSDFAAVQATVDAGTKLEHFDFYFDYVLELVGKLKPLWDV